MTVTTAIILAAGEGSRLRASAPHKPLCMVAGRALIDHALHNLHAAGLRRAVVVLGYGSEMIDAHLDGGSSALPVSIAYSDPRHPNGVSALAARPLLEGNEPALLVMCDHLVEPRLYARVAAAGAGDGLRLGIDRRIDHPWVDPDDVTRVATRGNRIVAIGKGMAAYDAHDTGVFAVGPALFDALAGLPSPSLTEGVRVLAAEGRAEVVDCSDCEWLDVDDPPALARAEAWLAPA